MSFELDEDFKWFLEEFGTPKENSRVSPTSLKKYKDILPNQLLDYWNEYGFCNFKNGLFYIVNPDDYRTHVDLWMKSAGLTNTSKYHAIARSGFGDILLWHEHEGDVFSIEPRDSEIFQKRGNLSKRGLNDAIRGFFATKSPKRLDLVDVDTDKLIFADAVKKFGPLAPDEMFTFEPALFMGGEQTLANVNKVNIHIQLELLAKMGTPQVMDINGLAKKAFS